MKKIEPYIWVGVLLTVLILIGAYHLGQRQVDECACREVNYEDETE